MLLILRRGLSDATLFIQFCVKITKSCTKAPVYKEPHKNKLCPHSIEYILYFGCLQYFVLSDQQTELWKY